MNIISLLHAAATRSPLNAAIKRGELTHLSFEAASRKVARMAKALVDASAGQIPTIAVFAANCPEYLEVMWAGWHAGMTVVPVNAKLHPRELEYIVVNCGASLCFLDDVRDQEWRRTGASAPACRMIRFDSDEYAALASSDAMPVAEVSDQDVAWLFYTSGTTGRPKGAMLTHRNLRGMCLRHYPDLGPVAPESHLVHAAPISHGSGLLSFAYVAQGACNVVPQSGGFDEEEIFSLFDALVDSSMFLAPTMLNRLTAYGATNAIKPDFDSIIYGGAPMYGEDLKKAIDLLGPRLIQIYGQGETPNTISYVPKEFHASHHPQAALLGSVGMARTGVDIAIVDDSGTVREVGAIGEIAVRSEVVMRGYLNEAEASSRALRDGWLYTGDIGSMDASGILWLKDRSKDVIISGGSNIYPREVEDVLLKHPGVREVAVIGAPSAEWGEEVVAYVVGEQTMLPAQESLDALCLQHIARFKRPKRYIFLASLPKSNYGKILKSELRKLDKLRA